MKSEDRDRLDDMGERLEKALARVEHANMRCIEVEARMTTFERVSAVEGGVRTDMLEQVLENQKAAELATQKISDRQHAVERKMAFYAGIGVVVGSIASNLISKALTFIKLP